jgi:hypothetical protein
VLTVNINRRHLKPGARYVVIEQARRMARINGSVNLKKGEIAKAGSFDQVRLAEAGLVIDFSLDGDLRDDEAIQGAKSAKSAYAFSDRPALDPSPRFPQLLGRRPAEIAARKKAALDAGLTPAS